MSYRVANANEMLVITGYGIPDFQLRKKAFIMPFRTCNVFTFTPLNYELQIHALSHEKLAIKIQSSLTVGPNVDIPEELNKYVRLLVNGKTPQLQEKVIRDRIVGIIEGEVRAVAASMDLESLFQNRKAFQGKVTEYIQEALNKFGCLLYNANVEELIDTAGYFSTVGQKAQEGAVAAAKVAIADSKMKGDIGVAEFSTKAAKETARLKAETTVFENEKAQLVAQSVADLDVKNAGFDAQVKIAQIESQKAAQMRDAELQKEVEKKRAAVETERLRAEQYARAVVEAEKIKVIADAKAYEKHIQAEASLYEMQKNAEGSLYMKLKEAEGIQKTYEAQATGLHKLIKAFENPKMALQYLMLEKGLFTQLAAENAKAIQGLQPKFNIWTTGNSKGDSDPSKPLRDIFSSLPPLLGAIQNQTGMGMNGPSVGIPIKSATTK